MHTLDSKLVASSVEICYMALTEINCAGFMTPLDKKVPDPWYNPMLVVHPHAGGTDTIDPY